MRYLPWIERTAVVLVDLVDVDTGAPVEVSPRRILQAQVDKAAAARLRADDRLARSSSSCSRRRSTTPTRRLPRPHAELAVPRGLPHPADDEGGGRARRDPARSAPAPACRSSSARARPGKGQHELNLTYQTAVEMADINLVFKNAVKEIAHSVGQVGDVHGQAVLRRRRLELPHPLEPVVDRRSSADAGAPRRARCPRRARTSRPAPYERAVPVVPRRPDRDRPRVQPAVRPDLNSYKRFQPGSWAPTGIGWDVDNRTLGLPRRRPRQRHARREPDPRRRRQHATTPSRPRSPAASTASSNRSTRPRPYSGNGYTATDLDAHPVERSRGDRAVAHSDDRQAVLRRRRASPRAESRRSGVVGVQQTVTDWERAPLLRAHLNPTIARDVHSGVLHNGRTSALSMGTSAGDEQTSITDAWGVHG